MSQKKGWTEMKHTNLHHILDASKSGYGVIAFIQSAIDDDQMFCNLVMTKSLVVPVKFLSLPSVLDKH